MRAFLAASLFLLVAGCGEDLDAVMWDCQLVVQSENAGKSPEAAEERAVAIDACMDRRGYRLDADKRACRLGSVTPTCYRHK